VSVDIFSHLTYSVRKGAEDLKQVNLRLSLSSLEACLCGSTISTVGFLSVVLAVTRFVEKFHELSELFLLLV